MSDSGISSNVFKSMSSKSIGEDMAASRRRRVNPRALEFVGKKYRDERIRAGIAFVRKKKKGGTGKRDMDSLD